METSKNTGYKGQICDRKQKQCNMGCANPDAQPIKSGFEIL
jgi:hypothetical protein